jgi:hypothetical protein
VYSDIFDGYQSIVKLIQCSYDGCDYEEFVSQEIVEASATPASPGNDE